MDSVLRDAARLKDSNTSDLKKGEYGSKKHPAQLCTHCAVIRLDDKGAGGAWCRDGKYPDDFENYSRRGDSEISLAVPYSRHDTLPELPSLQISANNGCSFCALLRRAILPLENTRLVPRFKTPLERSKFHSRGDLPSSEGGLSTRNICYIWTLTGSTSEEPRLERMEVEVFIENRNGEHEHYGLRFELSTLQGSQIPADMSRLLLMAAKGACANWLKIPLEPPIEGTLSQRSISTIKSWISACIGSCHPLKKNEEMPTRLIDVGKQDGYLPRLVVTSELPWVSPSFKYAALSYCWGPPTAQTLKTTRDSLRDHLRKISLHSFPRTIRDAVLVTRALGLQYLWVDALCIIQDDLTDWDLESSRMSEIFQGAYITIIPFHSSSCDDGFLNRPPVPMAEIPFQSSINPTVQGTYTLHPQIQKYSGDVPYLETSDSPWLSRGWTLQEHELSVRRLLFGKDRVVFWCSKKAMMETNAPCSSFGSRLDGTLVDRLELIESPAKLHSTWMGHIGHSYSTRHLSVAEDKLPAVSGLAKTLQQKTGDQYLAGHWSSELHDSLCWQPFLQTRDSMLVSKFLTRLTCPSPYVAPSWSWASYQRQVAFVGNPDQRPAFELLDTKIVLEGSDPFGRVQYGHLILRGKLMRPNEMPRSKLWLDSYKASAWYVRRLGKLLWTCYMDCLLKDTYGKGTQKQLLDRTAFFLLTRPIGTGLVLFNIEGGDEWVRIGVFQKHFDYSNESSAAFDACETRSVKIV